MKLCVVWSSVKRSQKLVKGCVRSYMSDENDNEDTSNRIKSYKLICKSLMTLMWGSYALTLHDSASVFYSLNQHNTSDESRQSADRSGNDKGVCNRSASSGCHSCEKVSSVSLSAGFCSWDRRYIEWVCNQLRESWTDKTY